MGVINDKLKKLEGFLISISRDTINGWYVIEVGLHKKWIFKSNENIECEVIQEVDEGKLVKVSPKNENVLIDDLLNFVEVIMEVNNKIAEKEKQFTDHMNEIKVKLEKEAKEFYSDLENLKDASFSDKFFNNVSLETEPKNEVKKRKYTKKTVDKSNLNKDNSNDKSDNELKSD